MDMPLFSVVVPIYNVNNYLNQCVLSVLSQDFMDFELILVDDGSTDGGGSTCDQFSALDRRVVVIHQENGGLSAARNTGLDNARGSYVWYLDGDDYLLERTAFSTVAAMIKEQNPDFVLFSYKKYYEKSCHYSKGMFRYLDQNSDLKECIRTNAYKVLACNKVVRLALVREHCMSFPVGRVGEDLVWCTDLVAFANSMCVCTDDLFAYRQRLGSITNKRTKDFHFRHLGDTLYLLRKMVDKFRVSGEQDSSNYLIGGLLAYEFSWILGEAFPYWKEYGEAVKELGFLLDFRLSRKASIVRLLQRLFGLKIAAFVLYTFIRARKILR